MRILSLFVALFCTSAVFAQQQAAPQPAAAPVAAPAAAPVAAQPAAPAVVTVNKPVIPETTPVAPAVVETPAAAPVAAAPQIENTMAWAMLNKNNELRAQVGLAPHRLNPQLTNAAQDHANYMASTGDFQHYSNGGPYGRAIKYGFAGGTGLENIAMGQWDVNSAFSTWRGSGAHWASIVSATTDAGFGYAVGRNGMAYWVGTYGNGAYVSYPSTAAAPSTTATPSTAVTAAPAATAVQVGAIVQGGTPYPTGTYPVGTTIREGKVYYPAGTVFNTQGQAIIR